MSIPRKQMVGPELVALGGVVVDHVEDDLDARLVQRLDHALELGDLLTPRAVCRVAVVRGEEPDRVVAPVVRQALVAQGEVVDELVHRHQLDGGDAEALEVLDDHRVRDARVGAADLLGDVGVGLGEALDVGFVDDAVVVLVPRQAVLAPVEERVDHHREHRVAEAVLDVRPGRVLAGRVEVVGEQRLVAVGLAVDRLGVGVEQELRGVAAVALGRVVGAVHAVAVALAGLHAGQVGVPHEAVHLGQLEPGLRAVVVDEAELDLVGHLGEQREVHAGAVIGRAEGVGLAGPDFHASPSS